MGRGKPLSAAEKTKIKVHAENKLPLRTIAKRIRRSVKIVWSFLRNKENYGKNMKGRQARATTEADRRKIIRLASNSSDSAAKIKAKSGITASLHTIRRVIRGSQHLKRLKLKKKPPLNPIQRQNRIDFCRNNMTWKEEWTKVVFSDEKNSI